MYNIFKNKVYSDFYSSFVKGNYTFLYEIASIEKVYINSKKTKMFFEVLDEEIGKRLYDVLDFLKKTRNQIITLSCKFTIKDFVFDKNNVVKWYVLDIKFAQDYSPEELLINRLKPEESRYSLEKWFESDYKAQLKEFLWLAERMVELGFRLQEDIKGEYYSENDEFVYCLSDLLSKFVLADGDDKTITEAKVLKFVHWVLTDTDFDVFCSRVFDQNIIYSAKKFEYSIPIINLAYDYYKKGAIDFDCFKILKTARFISLMDYYYIALDNDFETHFKITEKNNFYTVYDNKYKIINSDKAEICLSNNGWGLIDVKSLNEVLSQMIYEKIGEIVVGRYENEIGYTVSGYNDKTNWTALSELDVNATFNTQKEIFSFIYDMYYFLNVGCNLSFMENKSIFNFDVNIWDIESVILFHKDRKNKFEFCIKTAFDVCLLSNMGLYDIMTFLLNLVFKYLKEFVLKKYGTINNKKDVLKPIEVRCLDFDFMKYFISYALGKKVDYKKAVPAFVNFWRCKKTNEKLWYSEKLDFDPLEVPIVFDYEVKDKLNINCAEVSDDVYLSDGRRLHIFKKNSKKNIQEKLAKIRNDIKQHIGSFDERYVKFVGVSEVIYSSNKNYSKIGYITKEFHFDEVNMDYLCTLDNKELIKIMAYLYSRYTRFSFCDCVYNEPGGKVYVDILSPNFKIVKSDALAICGKDWIKYIIDMVDLYGNYNKDVLYDILKSAFNFASIDALLDDESWKLPDKLIKIYKNLNSFCKEHNVYYDDVCPICALTKIKLKSDVINNANLVFEDEYAKHYSLDEDFDYEEEFNAKIYKVGRTKLHEIEQNVDLILDAKYNPAESFSFMQDCFIPVKKILDENNRFIGVLYKKESFALDDNQNDVCISINDYIKLPNLHRIKAMIRFLEQIIEISDEYCFIYNPFTFVFLNHNHKKQVQILNIEFLKENSARKAQKNVVKWAMEYVLDIIKQDNNIGINLNDIDNVVDLYELKKLLEKRAEVLTKYCTIHKYYYEKQYCVCPRCISPKMIEQIKIKEDDMQNYDCTNPDDEGGEAFIFYRDDGFVTKIFKKSENDNSPKNIVLYRIMNKANILDKLNQKDRKYKYIFPKYLLRDKNTNLIFGYVMKKVNEAMPISNLKDVKVVEKLGFTRKDILEILITVGEGIEVLHNEANIFIGDLNGRNILFDKDKNIYFIDFDGMGIDEINPEFCTDGYIDPISKKNQKITMDDDWYSFAIQAFYYLTNTHPFNGIYTAEVNGVKCNLDIVQKMEKRISLLGNHGIKVPSIAKSWDWMCDELNQAFFEIFEGETRKNIAPILGKQYELLYSKKKSSENKSTTKVIKEEKNDENDLIYINSKFVAKKVEFDISKNATRVSSNDSCFAVIGDSFDRSIYLTRKYIGNSSFRKIFSPIPLEYIKNIFISNDLKIAFLIHDDGMAYVIGIDNGKVITEMIPSFHSKFFVNNKALYCYSPESSTIICAEIFYHTDNNEWSFRKKIYEREYPIVGFSARNNKFVIIEKIDDSTDRLYCNDEKLCDIIYGSKNSDKVQYNILYDQNTKKWLVVNIFGIGVLINPDRSYTRINFSNYCNLHNNMLNIYFNNGKIFIPNNNLTILDIKNLDNPKILDCKGLIKEDSKVIDVNSKGFSVLTDNTVYEIQRR